MPLDAIMQDDLTAAAEVDDLDAALAPLMAKAGIVTGDVGGVVFSGFDWPAAQPAERLEQLMRWMDAERAYSAADPRIVVVRAALTTPNFVFECYDLTADAAVAGLITALKRHGRAHRLPVDWHAAFDIELRDIRLGVGYRDREVIAT